MFQPQRCPNTRKARALSLNLGSTFQIRAFLQHGCLLLSLAAVLARGADAELTASIAPVSFEGTFFALTTVGNVTLSGSNTPSGASRITVNGEDALFNASATTWSKSHTLVPGFNRLLMQALNDTGGVLAETNLSVVLQLASSSVSGVLGSNTVWDSSMGIVHVTGNVVIPSGGTLLVKEGTALLLNAGASILATNASVMVQGTVRQPVHFLPSDGTGVWGGINVSGTNGTLSLQHAEAIAGYVHILNGATGVLEDSYLHDYTVSSPAIVSTFRPALLVMRRCRVSKYYEISSQYALNQIEDCLVEFPSGDAIDFDAGQPGSYIRNCTIRRGDDVNVDGIDLGYGYDSSPTIGVTIEGCVIYDFPFDKGVSLGEAAQNIVVRNCAIYDVDTGIAVKDSTTATIYNNTIVNTAFGMHLYQKGVTPGGGHGVAYNNIIWNAATNILLDSLSALSISNSDMEGTVPYPGLSNINENPQFLAGALHDYRLASNSPCVGTGTNGSNMGATFPVGSSLVDTDEDGMPDRWEMTYGFDFVSASDAALDADGDGLSNLAESVAGTDPRDPASVLKLSAAGFTPGGNRLEFFAVAGKDYTVQFRTNVSSGTWLKLLDLTAPISNTFLTVTDTNANNLSPRFYRLVTPAQP